MAAADLTIPTSPTGPAFQVISSIDLPSGQRLDAASVMGRADITYMSDDSLFLPFVVEAPDDAGKVDTDDRLHRYDEATGFTLLGELPVQQSTTNQAETVRAMTIGTDLYVATPAGIDVYQIESLARIASHHFLDR